MKIAIIGAGNMGGATARGLLAAISSGEAGKSGIQPCKPSGTSCASLRNNIVSQPDDLIVTARSEQTLEKFRSLGIRTSTDNAAAAREAEMVIFAVKPWQIEEVIAQIRGCLDYGRHIVVSFAAGVRGRQLESWLDRGGGQLPAIFAAMPNIAVETARGFTFIAPIREQSTSGGASRLNEVKALFDLLGGTMVTDEKLFSAGTSLASCGIAYALDYIKASSEGGIRMGFTPAQAREIVLQTVKGAISILESHGTEPQTEMDKVTTPGGLTEKGLQAMEESGFTQAIINGLNASLL